VVELDAGAGGRHLAAIARFSGGIVLDQRLLRRHGDAECLRHRVRQLAARCGVQRLEITPDGLGRGRDRGRWRRRCRRWRLWRPSRHARRLWRSGTAAAHPGHTFAGTLLTVTRVPCTSKTISIKPSSTWCPHSGHLNDSLILSIRILLNHLAGQNRVDDVLRCDSILLRLCQRMGVEKVL
jgi:hypothetical protein